MTNTPISLQQFASAWQRSPTVFTNAFEAAGRDALIGFYRQFRAQIPLRSRPVSATSPDRPPIKSAAAWPITTEGSTLDTLKVSIFTRSEAATLFEFGGTVRPRSGDSIAIPIAAARTRSGGVKPYYSTPQKRRARGDEFLLLRRGNVRYLHKLVPVKKRRRGRPRKDAKGVPVRPSAAPYFLLVDEVEVRAQLGFYSTWERYWPEATMRWTENVGCGVQLLLGQVVPPRCRRWIERRGGSLQVVNRGAS